MKLRLALLLASLAFGITALAQDETDCQPENLAQQQETFAQFLTLDFAADRGQSLASLFRLGAAYQAMALRCGYVPNKPETRIMLEQVLQFVTLDELTAAQAVGADVQRIMLELEGLPRRPIERAAALQRPRASPGRRRIGLRRLP